MQMINRSTKIKRRSRLAYSLRRDFFDVLLGTRVCLIIGPHSPWAPISSPVYRVKERHKSISYVCDGFWWVEVTAAAVCNAMQCEVTKAFVKSLSSWNKILQLNHRIIFFLGRVLFSFFLCPLNGSSSFFESMTSVWRLFWGTSFSNGFPAEAFSEHMLVGLGLKKPLSATDLRHYTCIHEEWQTEN